MAAIIASMSTNDPLEVNNRWSFPSTCPLRFKLFEEQELRRYCVRNVSAVALGLRGLIGDSLELEWVFDHCILSNRRKGCEGRCLTERSFVNLVILRALSRLLGFCFAIEPFTRLVLLLIYVLF